MTSLVEALPALIPLAVRWAKTQEAEACRVGRALHARERELAAGVGVARPELIRIVEVTHFPFPDHPLLSEAAQRGGLLGPNTAGLTLGYAVFVLRGETGDLALLSHEFRHVQQCEQLARIFRGGRGMIGGECRAEWRGLRTASSGAYWRARHRASGRPSPPSTRVARRDSLDFRLNPVRS